MRASFSHAMYPHVVPLRLEDLELVSTVPRVAGNCRQQIRDDAVHHAAATGEGAFGASGAAARGHGTSKSGGTIRTRTKRVSHLFNTRRAGPHVRPPKVEAGQVDDARRRDPSEIPPRLHGLYTRRSTRRAR